MTAKDGIVFGKGVLTYTRRGYIVEAETWKKQGIKLENPEDTIMDESCRKTKERGDEERQSLIHRLNRIEGQIRGIRGMVEKNAYCTDILTQVAAATAALNAFNRELLASHIRTCVVNDIREGKEETIDGLVDTLYKLMK